MLPGQKGGQPVKGKPARRAGLQCKQQQNHEQAQAATTYRDRTNELPP